MDDAIGRPKVALSYTWLIGLATLMVVVQGFLFSVFYSEGKEGVLTAHGEAGEVTGAVLLVILTPLGFLARFPRRMRVGWYTLLLAVVWNVQAHVLDYGIEDVSWFEMIHIPLAFFILASGLYLTVTTCKVLRKRES